MRRLCFAELVRRGELWAVASIPLKVYTLDENEFYGKVIRYEAMAELAGRTPPGEGAAEKSETTNEPGRKSPQSREGHQTVDAPDSAPAFQNRQGLETAATKGQKEHTR